MSEEKPNYFGILPASVRYCKKIPSSAKLLFAELTALTQREGYSWASNPYFADLFEVTPSTVSEWISKLQSNGFIRCEVDQSAGNKRKIWIAIPIIPGTYTEKTEDPYTEKPEHNNTRKNSKNNDIEEKANVIFSAYPKKVAKPAGIAAIKKALKKHKFEILLEKTKVFAVACLDRDKQFIPYPGTWFNQERFNDVIDSPHGEKPKFHGYDIDDINAGQEDRQLPLI